MGCASAEGVGHIGQTDATRIVCISSRHRYLAPRCFTHAPDLNRPAERVRVGYPQRSLGSINFDVREMVMPDIEAGNQGRNSSILELQCTGDVGRRIYFDHFAGVWLAGDLAFGESDAG